MEYSVFLTLLLAAVLTMQKFIVRGFAGRWKMTGDIFGQGMQYDPDKIIDEEALNPFNNEWYDADDYQQCYDDCRKSCMLYTLWDSAACGDVDCASGDFIKCDRCCDACCAGVL